jgi:predicted AAA+ superfamily ATPase
MGTLQLFPLTLEESLNSPQEKNLDAFVRGMKRGGMPVPMFLRDEDSRRLYFDSWIETTLIRDLARAYGKGYDLDFAKRVVQEMSEILLDGEYPDIGRFSKDSRKVKKYLHALANIFLVRRIPCHSAGTGKDHWIFGDGGIANHLLKSKTAAEGVTLSLARHYLYNELAAKSEYALKKDDIVYYKSTRGEPIDFVVNGTPIKVSVKSSGPYGWEEKGLIGSLKALKTNSGLLTAPIERGEPVKKKGISRVSWLHCC